MCSTPRPRKAIKGKGSKSGSLLSNMSSETRSRFAERANVAQERRHQITIKEQERNRQLQTPSKVTKKTVRHSTKKQSSLSYWLLDASLKEAFIMLFFGKSKQS